MHRVGERERWTTALEEDEKVMEKMKDNKEQMELCDISNKKKSGRGKCIISSVVDGLVSVQFSKCVEVYYYLSNWLRPSRRRGEIQSLFLYLVFLKWST